MPIPARAHFLWIGSDLPWAAAFAVLSAAARSGLDEITLHHTDALADTDAVRALHAAAPVVRVRRLDPEALLRRVGAALGRGDELLALHARLGTAVIRSDVLRAAVLFDEGGFYLDTDTITVRSLRSLAVRRAVVGTERVVWTPSARRSRSPVVLARHLALDLARKLCKVLPGGWALFRRIEPLYPRAPNNAVLGAERGSPLLRDYLGAMLSLEPGLEHRLYALGPALLGSVLARHAPDGLLVAEPSVFHPLAPEISAHWFRAARDPRPERVIGPDTLVVHWYASVRGPRGVGAITPASVRGRCRRELFSALVVAHVDPLPGPLDPRPIRSEARWGSVPRALSLGDAR